MRAEALWKDRAWLALAAVPGFLCFLALSDLKWVRQASASMEPTIPEGALVVTPRWTWRLTAGSPPARGAVVLLEKDRVLFVKRVVALPGETIELRDGRWSIDGKMVERARVSDEVYRESPPGAEPYLIRLEGADDGPLRRMPPLTLAPGQTFVMGDNRDNSMDSRRSVETGGLGPVPIDQLRGTPRFWFEWRP